jgi:hypothetical protein
LIHVLGLKSMGWIEFAFVLYTSKAFPQWSEFLLNCLYICIHMRVCVRWTSQTDEGNTMRSSVCIIVCPLAVQLCCSGSYNCYLCWLVGWIVCLVFYLGLLVQNFGVF